MSSTGFLKPHLFAARRKGGVNEAGLCFSPGEEPAPVLLRTGKKLPLKGDNPTHPTHTHPVGLPVVPRAGSLDTDHAATSALGGLLPSPSAQEDGSRVGDLCVFPGCPTGMWPQPWERLKPPIISGPESQPTSHCHSLSISPSYYTPSTTALVLRTTPVPDGSPC